MVTWTHLSSCRHFALHAETDRATGLEYTPSLKYVSEVASIVQPDSHGNGEGGAGDGAGPRPVEPTQEIPMHAFGCLESMQDCLQSSKLPTSFSGRKPLWYSSTQLWQPSTATCSQLGGGGGCRGGGGSGGGGGGSGGVGAGGGFGATPSTTDTLRVSVDGANMLR